jgi:uncharacterized damage-inducible protein DinB
MQQAQGLAEMFLAQAGHTLQDVYLPRINACVKRLSADDLWWRPHAGSNSVGNLILHLSGNVRQWIISGLGGAPDKRERGKEFAEAGPVPAGALLRRLRSTVIEACDVLHQLTGRDLKRDYIIQGFTTSGFNAVYHVAEHFAYHTGQIIYVTKLKCGEDLGFTHLPGDKPKRRPLPAI